MTAGGEGSPETQPASGAAAAMRIIVPLQGVVQGRGDLVLGSIIPCALYYLLQLYFKRHRLPPPPPPPAVRSSGDLPRTLSPRTSPAAVSSRASSVAKSDGSPISIGRQRCLEDPYHHRSNPNGVLQLGSMENQLSLDLVRGWISAHLKNLSLDEGGLETYHPYDGLMDLKIVVPNIVNDNDNGDMSK